MVIEGDNRDLRIVIKYNVRISGATSTKTKYFATTVKSPNLQIKLIWGKMAIIKPSAAQRQYFQSYEISSSFSKHINTICVSILHQYIC